MRSFIIVSATVLVVLSVTYLANLGLENKSSADTQDITITATVDTAMTFSATAGDTVAFGTLTPGSAVAAPATGTVLSVTTNAANGYTIGASDGTTGTDSCLLNADTTTRIGDYAGTITTPTSWTGTGLGFTLYAADTSKEATWGTGTTYNDANNKYAGAPETATTAHTVTGYHGSADTSSWAFKLDVPTTQKTGAYSCNEDNGNHYFTFTATAVLT